MPMATPMSALLQRRRVVDAVAGHGHDLAAAPAAPATSAHLVLGRDAGEHGDVRRSGRPSSAVGPCASSSAPVTARPAMPRSRAIAPRGGGVVAGDHLHGDAGAPARGDGLARLGPGRVDDADQADEASRSVHQRPASGRRPVERVAARCARPRRQHPQARRGQPIVVRLDGRPARRVERRDRPAVGDRRRPSERVGRALDHDAAPRRRASVEGRHELGGRVERHLGDARARRAAKRGGVDAALGREPPAARPRSGRRRTASPSAPTASLHERHGHEQRRRRSPGRRRRRRGGRRSRSPGRTPSAAPAVHERPVRRHLVQGERAGLVGADHASCEPSVSTDASRLHDRVPLGQLRAAPSARVTVDDRGQALGDRRHREGDRGQQRLAERLAPRQADGEDDERPRRRRRAASRCGPGGRAGPAAGSARARLRRAGRRCRPISVSMPVAVTTSSARPRRDRRVHEAQLRCGRRRARRARTRLRRPWPPGGTRR